jgi:hypothetical protein
MVEVLGTTEFEEWFLGLGSTDAQAGARGVGLLEAKGLALAGSRHALRELRVQSSGRPLRVLYAFDPRRQAVLILGGDKTGDDRFYLRMIPRAETIWERYLEELR